MLKLEGQITITFASSSTSTNNNNTSFCQNESTYLTIFSVLVYASTVQSS
jgi:hypothetical protein